MVNRQDLIGEYYRSCKNKKTLYILYEFNIIVINEDLKTHIT